VLCLPARRFHPHTACVGIDVYAKGTFMENNKGSRPVGRRLEAAQIEQFFADGFVRIDDALPRRLAEAAREILWKTTGCDPDDAATWTRR
jgi:hypothetical protein